MTLVQLLSSGVWTGTFDLLLSRFPIEELISTQERDVFKLALFELETGSALCIGDVQSVAFHDGVADHCFSPCDVLRFSIRTT
jgi:hypothetical protein